MYTKSGQLTEIENYRFFLDYVYKRIQKFIYDDPYVDEKSPDPTDPSLHYYFDQGKRIYQLIPKEVNYDEFIKNLDHTFIYNPYYVNRWKEAFYIRHNQPDFRARISFTKNDSVIKDKKDHSVKQSWREEKGITRDKAKAYFNRPYKTFAKKVSNKSFRRDQSRCLKSGDYDKLFDRKAKLYFDPWDWD